MYLRRSKWTKINRQENPLLIPFELCRIMNMTRRLHSDTVDLTHSWRRSSREKWMYWFPSHTCSVPLISTSFLHGALCRAFRLTALGDALPRSIQNTRKSPAPRHQVEHVYDCDRNRIADRHWIIVTFCNESPDLSECVLFADTPKKNAGYHRHELLIWLVSQFNTM